MKKLNTTYLDNLVSKVLKETLEEKADSLVSKIKGDVCECGGQMYEGECNECGYSNREMDEDIHDVEDINNKNEFDYVGESDMSESNQEDAVELCKKHIETFGEDDDVTQKMCQGVNLSESLKGRRRRQNRKSETDEGNAFTGALSQARKSGKKDFEVDGKKFETKEGKKFPDLSGDGKVTRKDVLLGRGVKLKEGEKFIQKAEKEIEKKGTEGSFKRYCGGEVTKSCIDKALKSGSSSLVKKANFAKNIKGYEGAKHKKKIKESYRLSESEMVSMIEKIVLEQKSKVVKDPAEKNNIKGFGGSPRGLEVYKKVHNQDGKENEDYIKSVAKKMKDYLKDGSKGEYSVNPKIFPKGNGELEKMSKKAYIPSGAVEEYVDNLTAAGQENLVYDEIHPNEEWVTDNIEGSSRTGNNPEWANTGESDVNKKRNKIRKDNILGQIKKKAYNKAPQPIVTDKSGEDEGEKLMTKLESIENKKQKQINEEFDRIKSLMGYNQKTQ
jgi:hypothetical protein